MGCSGSAVVRSGGVREEGGAAVSWGHGHGQHEGGEAGPGGPIQPLET